jgi:hypothetical protein
MDSVLKNVFSARLAHKLKKALNFGADYKAKKK